jgi:TRAP-type C4-dicarboxylate transport system permease small subunit
LQERGVHYFSDRDSPLEKIIGRVLTIFTYIGIGALFAMVFVTVRHAVGRYAFNSPVAGNAELSCIMLAILIFMVMAYTQMRKGHISVAVVTDRFSARTQAVIESIMNIVYLGLIVLTVWRTGVQFFFQIEHGNVTSVLHLPFFPVYFVLTFGWATLVVAVAVQLVNSLRAAAKGVQQ